MNEMLDHVAETETVKITLDKKATDDPRVAELRNRVKRCCCKYCGGQLSLRRIAYSRNENARIEIFCNNCDRIEFGVEPEIYKVAKYFAEEIKFDYYPDVDACERKKRMNVAKVSEIIAWGVKNLGLLTIEGFKFPMELDDEIIGESIVIEDRDLD